MVSHSALKSSKLYSDSRISDSNKAVGPSYALTVIVITNNAINNKEIFIFVNARKLNNFLIKK